MYINVDDRKITLLVCSYPDLSVLTSPKDVVDVSVSTSMTTMDVDVCGDFVNVCGDSVSVTGAINAAS